MTEHKEHNNVLYSQDRCNGCNKVINRWRRTTKRARIILIERTRVCPSCNNPSGIRSYY